MIRWRWRSSGQTARYPLLLNSTRLEQDGKRWWTARLQLLSVSRHRLVAVAFSSTVKDISSRCQMSPKHQIHPSSTPLGLLQLITFDRLFNLGLKYFAFSIWWFSPSILALSPFAHASFHDACIKYCFLLQAPTVLVHALRGFQNYILNTFMSTSSIPHFFLWLWRFYLRLCSRGKGNKWTNK